jgi:hypothetical protein
MSRNQQTVVALVAAALALAFVAWVDHSFVGDAVRRAGMNFDVGG